MSRGWLIFGAGVLVGVLSTIFVALLMLTQP